MLERSFYNLTNPQKSIWYTEEMFKGTTINNICTSGLIYGNIDENKLKESINNVILQNDSFRIHLTLKNGVVKQYISDYKTIPIDIEYISKDADLKQIEENEVKYVFNMIDSDLFKFKIVILKNKYACVILTANHIISDSWSMGLTIKNILSNYSSLESNTDIKTFSYADYIATEEVYKSSPKFNQDKKFWAEVFQTIPEQATIPSNSINSSHISSNAERLNFEIDKKLVNQINACCRENHFSLYNFFMAIFSIYIGNVSNTDDFVIGTPILNRTNYAEKHTTGMFVNTVPVRINNIFSHSFKTWVNYLAKNMISILRHQKYSYNSILEDIRLKNGNIPNLYNIIISYQITKAMDKQYGNYKTNWTFNNYCANDIDIHIYDINDSGNLSISYDYLINKYTSEDINHIHNRIVNMINQVLANINISTNDIKIITEKEKNVIIHDFNNTTRNYPRNKTIINLFEEQVKKVPNNTAIVFEDKKLTYKELNDRANSLADYLQKNNVHENEIVSIFMDKSLESIIAILAILKCRCAYMPIDIDYPLERINYMINNSNSNMILTLQTLKHKISSFSNILCVDLNNEIIYNTKVSNIKINSSSDDLAYIMYTSGSTGKPKGVMVSNRNVVRLIKNTNFITFMRNDRFLQTGSIVFDACTFEIWGSLLNGYELYIIKKQDLLDPYILENYLIKNKITILWITAPLFDQLSEQNPKMFNTVRVLLTGGDVLSPKHINSVKEACPNLTIINGYGPTENTTFSTCYTISQKFSSSIPIGYPIANSTCYVVSKNQQLMPIGTPGELLVGGDGVSKGYLNNIETTNSKFIPNIFGNGLMYKTGDLVKWNSDGSIDFIGRIDNQVKIRGFRVELSEINLAVQKFNNIKECVSIIKEINGEKVICTYYASTENIDISELRAFLKEHLPNYAIPSYFIKLDTLPINTNGKIDKNKLPEPQNKNIKKDIISPKNETELKLINILKKLLKADTISVDDDFFEIGGDSLSAINLIAHIQKEFKVQLFVKDIMDNSDISALADLIVKKANSSDYPKIKPIPKADYYETSSSQKRIYLTTKLAGENSLVYNIPGGIILDGNINIDLLNKCIKTLIDRHESFRTYFTLNNETLVQKVLENVDFKLNVIENEEFENLDKLFKEFVKPFDLSQAPLFRAEYIKFTNNKKALFIDLHHIIADGLSLSIFLDELCKLYNGESLSKLSITYKDFAKFQNDIINNGQLEQAENFWLNQFNDDIPILNMPTIATRPAVQSFEGKKIYSCIDSNTYKKIEKMSKDIGVTPFMLLLSCYYVLLSKYTSQDDIIVGTPIVGRNLYDTYNLIGMFVNTLALRHSVDDNLSFKDFVLNIKEFVLEAFKNEAYPFDELINKLNIKRDTGRNPLFDTMFIYQNEGYKELNFKDITAEYFIPDTKISKFDFSLEAIQQKDRIDINVEFSTKLFTQEFMTQFCEHYLIIINTVLDNCNIKISNICMLSAEEKHKILYDFNNTFVNYPINKTISKLFEEQVEKTPDDIALVFNDTTLTYKELNEKANSLAYELRFKQNIKRNDLVGIMVNRSLEMIIGILAILKSGGAYIPIDPTFPEERIDYMLKKSNSKVLLTLKSTENKIDYNNKLLIDLSNSSLYTNPTNNLDLINTPDDLSYVIFTSGSTGKPKGVMLKHKSLSNLCNYCNNYIEYLKKPSNIAIASITTISFDIFIFETLISLQRGLRVIIASEDQQTTPNLLNTLMEKNNVKIIQSTPSRMQILVNNLDYMPALKQLEFITLAGEQLPLSLVKSLHNISNCTIYNGYGPSETTVFSTLTKMNDDIITIGKPLDNTQIYILNNYLNPVPIGVPGELYISGDGVGLGYLDNTRLTQSSFIKNPYIPNTIMYKTGDLGMYHDDGSITCLGRSDNQVKIRGLRIELEEIESLILKYPYIQKSTVIKQTINERDFIFAYYVSSKPINTANIRDFLTKKLPRYMLPSYYIALDDMPYTPNGKIDRKSLPLPSELSSIGKEEYIAPETKIQKQLVNMFEKVLNTKPIGINDNFFELGGDSLLAMNLNIEIIKISNKITYSDIFRFPTVYELEKKILSDTSTPLFDKIENLSDSYEEILKKCTKRTRQQKYHPNNILITGATGYLGIHILDEFIRKEKGNVYCIIRESKGVTARTRLVQKLNYYFGNKYTDLIDKRIFAITGDITAPGFGLNQDELLELSNSVDIVINSAAIVAHFGNYGNFYKANVTSVKYIIDFCKTFNKKLYHISTISVSGSKLDLSYPESNKNKLVKFDESSLYIGQIIDIVYSRSKFEAECLVLNAIATGLDAYILRMGHLAPRLSDGVFQENIKNNDLSLKIASYAKLGFIPNYLQDYMLEITPVDCAANSIYRIITHPTGSNYIFNLYNYKKIPVKKLLKNFNRKEHKIEVLNEPDFIYKINSYLENEDLKNLLNNIINDFDNNMHLSYNTDIKIKSDFTVKYLKKSHFRWPRISNKYLKRFINLIRKEFLDTDEN